MRDVAPAGIIMIGVRDSRFGGFCGTLGLGDLLGCVCGEGLGKTFLGFWTPSFTDSKLRPWYVPIVSILKPSVSVGKIKISTVTFLGQNRHQLQLWKEIVGINANCTCMYFPISVHRNTDKNSKNGFPLTSPHQCCEGLKNSSLFFLIVFFSSKTKLMREEGKCYSCPNFHGQSLHSFRSVSTVLSGIVHIV